MRLTPTLTALMLWPMALAGQTIAAPPKIAPLPVIVAPVMAPSQSSVDTLCLSQSTKDSYLTEIGANNPGAYTGGTNCASGSLRFDWNGTRLKASVPIYLPDGTSGAPSIAFTSESNTGYRWRAAGAMTLGIAGVSHVDFARTGGSIWVSLASDDALGWSSGDPSAAAPDLQFTRPGVGQLTLTSVTTSLQVRKNISAVTESVTFRAAGTAETIAGNASNFRIVVGGTPGTTATVDFGVAWTVAPICTAQNEVTSNIMRPTASTTQLVLNGTVVASDKIAVHCEGY